MRTTPLVLGSALALAALLTLWLWPSEGDSTRAMMSAEARPGTASSPALPTLGQARSGQESRARAQASASEQTAPPAAEEGRAEGGQGLRLLRVRLLDEQTDRPLVGHGLSLSSRKFGLTSVLPEHEGTTDESGELELRAAVGEYVIQHVPTPGDPARIGRLLDTTVLEVPRGEVDDPHLVVIRGRYPPGILTVEVSHEDGTPAEDCAVTFRAGRDIWSSRHPHARTDALGRACLGVADPEGFTDAFLCAWDDQGNFSEKVPLEGPLVAGVYRLVLRPGGRVEVLVRDERLQPVAGRRLQLRSELESEGRFYGSSDEEGRFTFGPLAPGKYAVQDYEVSSLKRESQVVEVRSGAVQVVEFHLQEWGHAPAVSGRVVDESGEPLEFVSLAVTPDDGWSEGVVTQEDGSFKLYRDGVDSFLVQANSDPYGDRYEPASFEVPSGTHDLLFRRTRRSVTRTFDVEVFDQATGEEVESFVVAIDHGEENADGAINLQAARSFEVQVLPETRCTINSQGYIARCLVLERELDRLEGDERLRVGLERGLDCTLVVLDIDTLEPLSGVLFSSNEEGQARSDARGVVHLRAAEWSLYSVSKEGYDPDELDPTDLLWGMSEFGLFRTEPSDG